MKKTPKVSEQTHQRKPARKILEQWMANGPADKQQDPSAKTTLNPKATIVEGYIYFHSFHKPFDKTYSADLPEKSGIQFSQGEVDTRVSLGSHRL